MMKKLLVICLLLSGLPAKAETLIDATYTLKWGNTAIGNVNRKLEKKGDTYTFTSIAKPQGLAVFLTKGIEEKSVFTLSGKKIRPVSYFYHLKGKKSKKVVHQYTGNTLKILEPKPLTISPLNPHTVDALNSQYMVMQGLSQGKHSFQVALYEDEKKPKVYGLKHSGNIKINTPAGRFDTVLVSKVQTNQKKFNLWCAPSLNYLPVKISYVNKRGQTFTMELVEAR